MNEELATRYAEALRETLGYEGRMISASKSGYRERFPDRVPIFNANVCVAAGKVWHGDLDLSVDEPLLVDLSARIGETVWVLYEHHGRFANEGTPLLGQAVYSVTPSGHTRYMHQYIERATDGTLRRRPSPSRPRWRWRVLVHRPRLLRFWVIEQTSKRNNAVERGHARLLYVGRRDSGKTPLLILGLTRGGRLRQLGIEVTWYPAAGLDRSAARELIKLSPDIHLGPLELWANLIVWPGRIYQAQAAYQLKPRSR